MCLWSEQIDKIFTQSLGQILVAKVPLVCLEIRGF